MEKKWPWETEGPAWKAYVHHELKAAVDGSEEFAAMTVETFDLKLRAMYENPPSWSTIRNVYEIFKAGFNAKPKPVVYLFVDSTSLDISLYSIETEDDHERDKWTIAVRENRPGTAPFATANVIQNILEKAGIRVVKE